MVPIVNAYELFEKIQSADMSAYRQRCVAVRNRRATCSRCVQACTSGAIAIDDNSLVITPEKCIGCGTCATACPTCALEAHMPNDAQLQASAIRAMHAADGLSVIACRQIVDAAGGRLDDEKVVAVECLSRIEESLLIALAAEDCRKVVLVAGKCSSCNRVVGFEMARAVCDTCNELMRVWSCSMRVDISERFPSSVRADASQACDASRRNFFFRAKDETRLAAYFTAEQVLGGPESDSMALVGNSDAENHTVMKVMDDGTLPHFVPDRRERLLDNLAVLGDPADELMETRLWGHVVELLDNRVSPSDILVVTATDEAATSFANRLTAMSKEAANVRVYSAFSLVASLACGVSYVADKPMAIAQRLNAIFSLLTL